MDVRVRCGIQVRDFDWPDGLNVGEAARRAARSFGSKLMKPALLDDSCNILDERLSLRLCGVGPGSILALEFLDDTGG